MTPNNPYVRLLGNLKTGVILLDSNLHLGYINMAAENLLEISHKQVASLFLGEIFIGAGEDITEIRNALQTGASFTKHKATLRLTNGKDIVVDYSINTYEDEDGEHVLMEIQPLNYYQRISREEALISTHATTRELVRGLAHEIKNPLGGIRGAAQLLAQELPDEELKDYTNVIIEEADRLRNLVDRLVGDRKPPDMKPLNIHEVLERVRNLVEAEIDKQAIKLDRDYDPSIPPLRGDSEQLIQAVLNIVRNAMQALSSNGVDHDLGTILLRTRITRNATVGTKFHRLVARIDVIDNGPGIPANLIDNIFYPMISGRADGSGLGLSIAQAIINQHEGIIECESRRGYTNFSISLPLLDT
ncbi:MAG: nitrogen regulation protein NR(II) [Pseudohongiellaceae bacterium]